jgi:hypothetical protein
LTNQLTAKRLFGFRNRRAKFRKLKSNTDLIGAENPRIKGKVATPTLLTFWIIHQILEANNPKVVKTLPMRKAQPSDLDEFFHNPAIPAEVTEPDSLIGKHVGG